MKTINIIASYYVDSLAFYIATDLMKPFRYCYKHTLALVNYVVVRLIQLTYMEDLRLGQLPITINGITIMGIYCNYIAI